MSTDFEPYRRCDEPADPDPIVLISLCFSGVGMAAGVAAAIMQGISLNIQRRQDRSRENADKAELLAEIQHLKITLDNLKIRVSSFRRNANIAQSFIDNSKKTNEKQGRFSLGTSFVDLSDSSLQMWNLLVENITTDIRLMNGYVIESSRSISIIFRLLGALSHSERKLYYHMREHMHEVYHEAERFKRLLVQYQSLTSNSQLNRAMKVLNELCDAAEGMIDPIIRIFRRSLDEIDFNG